MNIGWTSKEYLEMESGLRIEDKDSAGIFDCYTLPDHRSKGIYVESLIRMALAAKAAGVQRVLIAVDPVNLPSIKGIERAGFKPLYQVTRTRRYGRSEVLNRAFETKASA